MSKLNQTMTEISQLLANIETNYPELYCFLDESPITIPSEAHPDMGEKVMNEYLESLKVLLKEHMLRHAQKQLVSA